MSHFLALDQGTSSSRAIVFDDQGQILSVGQRPFDMRFPQDGWVEQDPEVLWSTTIESAREALDRAGLSAQALSGVGITNQRETVLLWDRQTGECVHPAIVWQDRRTHEFCVGLQNEGLESELRALTGLVVDPYFSASKLKWLLDHEPGLRQRAARGELCFGTVDSFLIFRLTGGQAHVTDATNASRTQLFDIHQQAWSERLLEVFDIPESLLPDVLDSAGNFGTTSAEWLGASVPITGVAGDQQAALIGQCCVSPGMSKSTYGTGCFAMVNTGGEAPTSNHALLTTVAYRLGNETTYALEGSIFVAGQAVKWLRDELGLVGEAADSEALCESTGGDTKGVYVVPAFTGLGAPHWRADARGLITGLTLASNRAEVVTATIQAVAFQTRELLDAMAADGARVDALRVDGGMVENSWFCQFLADTLAVDVQRPVITETTALGAAILAAVGSGTFSSLADAASMWRCERSFAPEMDESRRAQLFDGWQQAVARALA